MQRTVINSGVYGISLFVFLLQSATVSSDFSTLSSEHVETYLLQCGFVDVQQLDSTIKVDLKYAREDNFMGSNVYGNMRKCFLQKKPAEMLFAANRNLKAIRPDLSFLVVDGLRPRHVQRKMWELVKGTPMQPYVADPRFGSMHNYGCAVDITLIDELGNQLDMGTPVDHFGIRAQVRLEKTLLQQGKLTSEQVANRILLREVMTSAGFIPLAIEWWHFEAFDKEYIRRNFTIIE